MRRRLASRATPALASSAAATASTVGGAAGTEGGGLPDVTSSGWETGVAGSTSPLPAWVAVMFALPAPTIVRTLPDTVATEGLSLANATGRPEVAAPVSVSGGLP